MPGVDCQAMRVIVADLDARNEGIENFETLCREHGIDVGDCPMVKTPTGGIHFFFADLAGRWRNSASKLAPGVDTRSVGGYVVAAGALRRGFGLYEPVRPASLTEFIASLAGQRSPPPPKPLADLLDKHCLPGAPGLRTAIRRLLTTVLVAAPAVRFPTTTPTTTTPTPQSALFDGMEWEELTLGAREPWTLGGALSVMAAATPGTRNDLFARQAFTAGLRASALGLDPDQTVDALIEAAGVAGSTDAKTTDTIVRCFEAGMRHADEEAATIAAAALSPATVAASSPGGTASWTAAYEAAALKAAKSRLHDAFVIARMLGQHRIRDDLVRKALTVADIRVRAKLMFTLAAFLLKSDHSWGEIVDAVVACGLPRATGVAAFVWAQKHVAKG
jgi:Bifunctional DNA primase/polymerase, N-terminal